MKKLAVIGCGIAAYPILKKARELRIQTYCFSLGINPKVENLYDNHVKIDYYDIESIVEHCRRLEINGVIATGENTTATTAYVAKQLGLPGNRYDDVFTCNNKYEQRKVLEKAKYVKQPLFYVYNGSLPNFPVIVKAVDSSGKKGISIAKNEKEFIQAIQYSKDASSNDIILVEQYLDGGEEYSVECISAKGHHQIIQITKKDVSGPPHFAELGHHQPGIIPIPYDKFEEAIFEILDKVGVLNSISHIEVKIIENSVYFIEIGARGGGDRISDTLIYYSTDFDYYKAAIHVALGEYNFKKASNTHHSGIYYLCEQTKYLSPLFDYAKDQEWCKEIKMPCNGLMRKDGNDDGNTSGYLIYQSDHMITLNDIPFTIERINDNNNALSMLCEFTIASKRNISEDDMIRGMQKFIDNGNVIGCCFGERLYGMTNIYINDIESRDAYLNNVEILKEYRGLGLSKRILKFAYQFIINKHFKSVSLDVKSDNEIAVSLYKKEGFSLTGKEKIVNNEVFVEMRKILV